VSNRRGFGGRFDPELEDALAALTSEDLRALLGDALDELDGRPLARLVDSILTRAAKGRGRWKPATGRGESVAEVQRFVKVALRAGEAEPGDVEVWLREGTKAFLAGDL